MKKFVCSLLTIFVLWLAIDRLGGAAMYWVTWHSHERYTSKVRKVVSDLDADIVFLGTSRCENHYVSSIIADSTGMSVYNAGVSGSESIYFQYATLMHILRHHTPKVIVLEADESAYTRADNMRLAYYAPYIGLCPAADSVFHWVGTMARYRISHLYRYHSLSNVAIARLFRPEEPDDNGYNEIPCPLSFPVALGGEPEPVAVDAATVALLRRFIATCREHGILLVLSISPSLVQPDEHYYDVIKDIAREEQLPLLDYDTDGFLTGHLEYFRDLAHLWHRGARIYSQRFAHDLNTILNDK